MNIIWKKEIPQKEGLYWSCYQNKNKAWKIGLSEIYFIGKAKIVKIYNCGTMSIPYKISEEEARKHFGWEEVLFSHEEVIPPKLPKKFTGKK